jgi:hypothetical protein
VVDREIGRKSRIGKGWMEEKGGRDWLSERRLRFRDLDLYCGLCLRLGEAGETATEGRDWIDIRERMLL